MEAEQAHLRGAQEEPQGELLMAACLVPLVSHLPLDLMTWAIVLPGAHHLLRSTLE